MLLMASSYVLFFFFKQKTAYELRISYWSSDVCSSDLRALSVAALGDDGHGGCAAGRGVGGHPADAGRDVHRGSHLPGAGPGHQRGVHGHADAGVVRHHRVQCKGRVMVEAATEQALGLGAWAVSTSTDEGVRGLGLG